MEISKSTLGLFRIMESLSQFKNLTVIGNLISAKIGYFEMMISIYCFENDGDLVVILTTEPKQTLRDEPEKRICGVTEKLFSEDNNESNRDLKRYEEKFLKIIKLCRTKGSVNVTIQDYSLAVKIYDCNENFSLTNFFYVFNDLDLIFLGQPTN